MRKLTRVIGLVFLMVIPVLSVVAQDNVVDEVVWIVGDDAIFEVRSRRTISKFAIRRTEN